MPCLYPQTSSTWRCSCPILFRPSLISLARLHERRLCFACGNSAQPNVAAGSGSSNGKVDSAAASLKMALQWGLLAILQSSAPAAAPWKPKVSRKLSSRPSCGDVD